MYVDEWRKYYQRLVVSESGEKKRRISGYLGSPPSRHRTLEMTAGWCLQFGRS